MRRVTRHVQVETDLPYTVWFLKGSQQAVAGLVSRRPNYEAVEVSRRWRTDSEKRAVALASTINAMVRAS